MDNKDRLTVVDIFFLGISVAALAFMLGLGKL